MEEKREKMCYIENGQENVKKKSQLQGREKRERKTPNAWWKRQGNKIPLKIFGGGRKTHTKIQCSP